MHLWPPGVRRDRPGRFWDAAASVVVERRYLILIGWIAVAVLATVFLPVISSSGAIGNLVPENSAALRAEVDATRLFGLPLTSGVEVVQRDPHRFPRAEQTRAARAAVAVDQGRVHGIYGLAGSLPVVNTARLFPGAGERSTTIVTVLYFRPGTSLGAQTRGAHEYVRRYLSAPQDHVVGVTGVSVARDAQAQIIVAHLPWVELATVMAIAVIVGLQFGSVGAPLATLACVGVAYLVAVRVVAWAGQQAGITVPPDLEPVLVVLLLGVTTDYAVFFLAGMRGRLEEGDGRMQAARRVTAEYLPIIMTAGLIVTAGSAALSAARLAVLRSLGPGLALTVLTAMVVAVTLTPALIAIFGRLLFLPGRAPHPAGNWRERVARAATGRRAAALIAAGCVVGLLVMAAGVFGMRLALPLIRALPGGSEAVRAQAAAAQGFVPGILAPTEILALGPGVGTQGPRWRGWNTPWPPGPAWPPWWVRPM